MTVFSQLILSQALLFPPYFLDALKIMPRVSASPGVLPNWTVAFGLVFDDSPAVRKEEGNLSNHNDHNSKIVT